MLIFVSKTLFDTLKEWIVRPYKVFSKWAFPDLWGEEVQGYGVMESHHPLECNVDIFRPGKVNQIRVKFFNLTRGDDASNDFRCAFLKFGDSENEGPFDLSFTTGRMSCYNSTRSLNEFLNAMNGDDDSVKAWANQKPINYNALADGIRSYPKCRTDLDYYNHATFTIDTGSCSKLVRFRLHGNNDEDSRLTKQEKETTPWIKRRPDIKLPSDTYLQQKLRKIAVENKKMKLQVQIRDGNEVGQSVYDPMTAWEESEYPWQDVADLLLTYSVPQIYTERAKFNFTKAPDGIQMCVPVGMDNFGGLILKQEKCLTSNVRKKYPEGEVPSDGKETAFAVYVETGNDILAGTRADVYITLYGAKGRTKKILIYTTKTPLLDQLFGNKKSYNMYYITVPAIGDVKFIQVFLIGGKYTFARDWFLNKYTSARDWFLNKIGFHHKICGGKKPFAPYWFLNQLVLVDLTTRKHFDLPVYRWISDKLVLQTGNAKLPQDEIDRDRRYLRQMWLDERLEIYRWRHVEGLPGCIDCCDSTELPIDMTYSTTRRAETSVVPFLDYTKLFLQGFLNNCHSFDSFDDFKAMCKNIPQSETMAHIMKDDKWDTDEEFGREFLAGVNPVMIKRFTKELAKFPVTNEMVKSLLDRGMTLDEEIKAGHIYYADYHHTTGIPRQGEFVVTDSLVMFYVKASGQLVPIAIQLGQTPGAENPIWTPKDDDWKLAKMFVKASDVHYQVVYFHLGQTHFLMEAITLAMHRQLHPNHPIFRLLIQYTRYTVAAGQLGRDLLIEGNDPIFKKLFAIPGYDFMKRRFNDFTVNELIMPKNFLDRGVHDDKLLPNYPFRDDALLIWDKLMEYVTKMTWLFYENDDAVVDDSELQGFLADLRDNGLPMSNGQQNGVPSKLSTIGEMVDLMTMIMFHSSCFHSAMNYPQLDYYCFGPNYPVSMRKGPPSEKGKTTNQDMMDTLPNKCTQAKMIIVSDLLSAPESNEIYLGDYAESQFTESEARELQEEFSKEMEEVSHIIQTRNLERDVPYVYLIPQQVTKAAGQ